MGRGSELRAGKEKGRVSLPILRVGSFYFFSSFFLLVYSVTYDRNSGRSVLSKTSYWRYLISYVMVILIFLSYELVRRLCLIPKS